MLSSLGRASDDGQVRKRCHIDDLELMLELLMYALKDETGSWRERLGCP